MRTCAGESSLNVAALRQGGLSYRAVEEDDVFDVPAADITVATEPELGGVGPVDAVILAVKSFQVDEATLEPLAPLVGPDTIVISTQKSAPNPSLKHTHHPTHSTRADPSAASARLAAGWRRMTRSQRSSAPSGPSSASSACSPTSKARTRQALTTAHPSLETNPVPDSESESGRELSCKLIAWWVRVRAGIRPCHSQEHPRLV